MGRELTLLSDKKSTFLSQGSSDGVLELEGPLPRLVASRGRRRRTEEEERACVMEEKGAMEGVMGAIDTKGPEKNGKGDPKISRHDGMTIRFLVLSG